MDAEQKLDLVSDCETLSVKLTCEQVLVVSTVSLLFDIWSLSVTMALTMETDHQISCQSLLHEINVLTRTLWPVTVGWFSLETFSFSVS